MDDSQATISAVSKSIESRGVVHFSCHAVQDAQDPLKSGFLLRDGRLELSACQTAAGHESLPGEAVHLAAGMLIAGFPSVVATMWWIRDVDAPIVAQGFYHRLLTEKMKSAEALHHAVAELRVRVRENDFLSWVPFVHFGHWFESSFYILCLPVFLLLPCNLTRFCLLLSRVFQFEN